MKAVFRCDATTLIGFGHLSRCVALAEALRISGITSTFAGQFDTAANDLIAESGFECAELGDPVNTGHSDRRFADMMIEASDFFVVVDSYRVNEDYLSALRRFGKPIIVIDDFAALETYPCEVVLNFTWEANSLAYAGGPIPLLGPGYFLARRRLIELRPQSIERRRSGPVRNLLVVIGGADPRHIAARVARILSLDQTNICLRVIAARDTDLSDAIAQFAPGSLVLPRQPDLSEQLLWADACITGGGLIKYESAFMGVPAAAIAQNEGQDKETRDLARAGLVFDLGPADDRCDKELGQELYRFLGDDDLRNGMAARVRKIFPRDPAVDAARAIMEAIGH